MSRRLRSGGDDPAEAEVEQLLRAAEDDLLLKLSVGTHSSRSSPLDPLLARRFEDLKSPPPLPSSAAQPRPTSPLKTVTKGGVPSASDDGQLGDVLGDDLAMRFAALKGSSSSGTGRSDPVIHNSGLATQQRKLSLDEEEEEEEEEEGVSKKEVDKLLQWAMDAARLDPSKSDDEDDSSEGEEELDLKRKIGKEEKVKPKKRRLAKSPRRLPWRSLTQALAEWSATLRRRLLQRAPATARPTSGALTPALATSAPTWPSSSLPSSVPPSSPSPSAPPSVSSSVASAGNASL